MYWRNNSGNLLVSAISIALGTLMLFTEIIKNDPVSFGVIPSVSNALIGSLFIIKGIMWGKSLFIQQINPKRKIDYLGLGISIFTFIIAAKVLQTGVLYSRNAWFHLEVVEQYTVGCILVISGAYMAYNSIEYLRNW